MFKFLLVPIEMFSNLWKHRELIKVLTKREIQEKYRGSLLGLLWLFFNPLIMLSIYTFVFSFIFKMRWSGGSASKIEFALLLFAGLLIFYILIDCLNRSPSLILSNINYVKKVIFPLEILPIVVLFSSLFQAFINLSVWFLFYIIFIGFPSLSVLYLPFVLIPFCLFVMGVSWFLASLGVFFRDISQLVGPLTTALMFISPIFYPASAFPENYRKFIYLNPITPAIENVRNLLFWGKTPDFSILGIYGTVSLIFACLGFSWFQKTRKGFADVI